MPIEFLPEKSYPQNSEDGFPVGQSFYLAFSNSVDLKLLEKSCVLFGKDFDRSTGPNEALALNISDSTNPFFLKSPGLTGFVECDFEEYFVDNFDDNSPSATQYLLDKVDSKNTIVKVTPKVPLGENQEYKLYLLGSSSEEIEAGAPAYIDILAKNNTLSKRTIYDVKDSNDALEEKVRSKGTYSPENFENNSVLNIKIIKEGEGSKANYIWWFADEQEPLPANPSYSERTNRCLQRWRSLSRGVMLKFTGGTFALNETFKVNCYKPEELLKSFLITFRTSTDSIYTYPDNVSTSPIGLGANIIPGLNGNAAVVEDLKIIKIEPNDASINNKLNLKNIIIYFNKNLDPNTVSQDSIELVSYPVSGSFDYSGNKMKRERKLYKIVSVEDNKIIVEL